MIALLALVAGGAIWLDRRRHSQVRARPDLSLPALNEAPFGVLGLAKTGELAFANPVARRLLGLDIATGALPEADWADRLQADSDAARHDGAAAGRYRIVPLPPDRFVRWWAMAGGELVFLFDATEQQRAVREVNVSVYCFDAGALRWVLPRLTNHNAKGEYYLTDALALLRQDGQKLAAVAAVPPEDVLSINTLDELQQVGSILADRLRAGEASP